MKKNKKVIILAVCFAIVCLIICAYTYKGGQTSTVNSQAGNGANSSQNNANSSDAEENSSSPETQPADGWVVQEDNTYYYQNNVPITSDWLSLDNNTYYFDKDGKMCTGSVTIDKKKYRFNDDGSMIIGWYPSSSNKKYYYNKKGQLLTNTAVVIDKIVYSFNNKGKVVHQADSTKPMIALTYDDGPSQNTSSIVSTLKKYDSVATFFVVAERISYYPESFKKAYASGCEIGSHTYSHVMLNKMSSSAIKAELKKANTEIKKYLGVPSIVLRPPGGNINDTVSAAVDAPMILWSVDTEDWKNRNSATTTQRALNNAKDGDIILMHDLYESTAEAAKKIIPSLIDDGFQLVTVSELAACRGGMKDGEHYFSFEP